MSRMFRPVVEQWGTSQDTFIEHENLLTLLRAVDDNLAVTAPDTKFDACQSEYGDMTVVTIHEGRAFIAFVANDLTVLMAERFLAEDGAHELRDDLEALVGNLKIAAINGEWTKMLDDGVLRFYID
jgi:hypothetical protein